MTRTFISYGGGDEAFAVRVYDYLRPLTYCDPWLYTRKVVGGADAHRQISAAINDADLFVMLVSLESLRRRGYFQVEMKEALKRSSYVPIGQPYLIACLLDDVATEDLPIELQVPHCLQLDRGSPDFSELKRAIAEANDYPSQLNKRLDVVFTTHSGQFRHLSPEQFQFVTITNNSSASLEVTHVFYRDPDWDILFHPEARKLPHTLEPGKSWETYVPVRYLTPGIEYDTCFRVVFSRDETLQLQSRRGTPPLAGYVAGGPIDDAEILSYPTPLKFPR